MTHFWSTGLVTEDYGRQKQVSRNAGKLPSAGSTKLPLVPVPIATVLTEKSCSTPPTPTPHILPVFRS